MKTKRTVEALALVGVAAGLAVTSGCRTTYSYPADLSLAPMPVSVEPEPIGNVTYPVAEAEKPKPYWQEHPEVVSALDKTPATLDAAAKAGTSYSGYVVKPGDSISKIAAAHGFRTADVLAVNPGLSPNKIFTGQRIVLPGAASAQPVSTHASDSKASSVAGGTYIVKKGDILGRIANQHGVKVSDLKKANGLTGDKILVGQKLVIPGAKAAVQPKAESKPAAQPKASAVEPKAPAVQPKVESKPAAQPKAPVVQQKPKVVRPPAIEPVVPEVAPPAIDPPTPAPLSQHAVKAPAPPKGTPYIVQEGQDLFDISVKWGVSASEIKALNNLTSDDVTPGQTLMIPAPRAE